MVCSYNDIVCFNDIFFVLFNKYQFLSSIFITFLISFVIFQIANSLLASYDISNEMKKILNRSMLGVFVVGLCLIHLFNKTKNRSIFNNKPNWNAYIKLPFHKIKTINFFLIAIAVSIAIFMPLVIKQELNDIRSLLLFCLLFSLINATLEEIIWRGIMLSTLKNDVSVIYAVIVTSIGFGLLHLAIGFSLGISLLFAFGGVFYAVVVLKTNSIYPSIILHIIINIGMVFSGLIV